MKKPIAMLLTLTFLVFTLVPQSVANTIYVDAAPVYRWCWDGSGYYQDCYVAFGSMCSPTSCDIIGNL